MDFDDFYNGILENFSIPEVFADEILTTIEFRLKKNHYHFNNINRYINESYEDNEEHIYFESENLIINIRSTVDSILQLINAAYKMNLKGINVNIKNILTHSNCPESLKDIFRVHTHPKNHFWYFIYMTRNEIVHEVCIKSKLPMLQDEVYKYNSFEKIVYFVNIKGNKEELLFFYKQCIKLIDEFSEQILISLKKGLF